MQTADTMIVAGVRPIPHQSASAEPPSTALVAKKPTYIRTTSSSGRIAP